MLNFPNESRSYDATRRSVRFWGYDGAIEISFFVEEAALFQIAPERKRDEFAVLECFDANRDHILTVARAVYARRRKAAYTLFAHDF